MRRNCRRRGSSTAVWAATDAKCAFIHCKRAKSLRRGPSALLGSRVRHGVSNQQAMLVDDQSAAVACRLFHSGLSVGFDRSVHCPCASHARRSRWVQICNTIQADWQRLTAPVQSKTRSFLVVESPCISRRIPDAAAAAGAHRKHRLGGPLGTVGAVGINRWSSGGQKFRGDDADVIRRDYEYTNDCAAMVQLLQ